LSFVCKDLGIPNTEKHKTKQKQSKRTQSSYLCPVTKFNNTF